MQSSCCEVASGHRASIVLWSEVLGSPLIPTGSLVTLLHGARPGQWGSQVVCTGLRCSRASPDSPATTWHAGQGRCSQAKAPELLKCHQSHCYLDVSPR